MLQTVLYQRENQGFNVRYNEPDYFSLIILELSKLENLSKEYQDELLLISKYVRRNILDCYISKQIYQVFFRLNYITELFSNIFGKGNYWTIDTVIDYSKHVFSKFPNCSRDTDKAKLVDEIYMVNMKKNIIPQWENILEATNSENAFIDIFDDFFTNAIEKYPNIFIKKIKESYVLCRMVKVKKCDANRFIPLPECTYQNRWNPPGKSFLYMSYGECEHYYDGNISLEEKVCLLECRTERDTEVSFCNFKPRNEGRILDLSYNDIEVTELNDELNTFSNSHTDRIIEEILLENRYNKDSLKSEINQNELKKNIKEKIDAIPNTYEKVTEIVAKHFFKLVCSCIYSKVDGSEEEKENEYKSFHILSNYLKSKDITGIIYPCTRDMSLKGKNVVLFEPNDALPIPSSIRRYHYK